MPKEKLLLISILIALSLLTFSCRRIANIIGPQEPEGKPVIDEPVEVSLRMVPSTPLFVD